MLDYLVDKIFVVFAGKKFFQLIDLIPTRTNWAPLLADTLPYSYEAECIQSFFQREEKVVNSVQFHIKYIDDILSINNHEFENYQGGCILLNLRSKTPQRAALLLLICIYFCRSGGTVNSTFLYRKRDDFKFHIHFLFLNIKIPTSPYGVFISQLIGLLHAWKFYSEGDANSQLVSWYVKECLKSSLRKFMVDKGILFNNCMKFNLTNVKCHPLAWPYTKRKRTGSDSVLWWKS